MASFFRWRIADKVIGLLSKNSETYLKPGTISSIVRVSQGRGDHGKLLLPWQRLLQLTQPNGDLNPKDFVRSLKNQGLPTAEGFVDITFSQSPLSIIFTVDKHVFSKIVLTDICGNDEIVAKSSCLFQNVLKKKVMVEYNLPKVGEKIQMSHFRSAIHCNFIANINKMAGHDVIKLLHVKDLTLSSAIFLLGCERLASKEEMIKKPSSHMSEVYQAAHLLYESDTNFSQQADSYYEKLKKGDKSTLAQWHELTALHLKHCDIFHKKVNLSFDDTIFESSYSSESIEIFKKLLEKNLIAIAEPGRIDLHEAVKSATNIKIEKPFSEPFIHSICGSISSAVDLKEKHSFDVMYQVARTSDKTSYFLLAHFLKELGYSFPEKMHHVKLKEITEFSRRSKDFEEILNRSKLFMLENLQAKLGMEINETTEAMAENLSLSSLCVHDMKHRRCVDYEFSWNEILSLGRTGGALLQLCHAGLKGVQDDSEYKFKLDIDTSPILQSEALDLIQHLARFDETVYKAYLSLEPCIMLNYLFSLWFFTDKATNVLNINIKDDRLIVLKARLMLLSATLKVLQRGLHILGLTPLDTNYTQPDFIKSEEL